ncbi:hypothetical protein [Deinococcus sp. UR1]|uniref:hypothetical protein n=1 Tax=Deinococcus sp. UR1 TaxID=1704277 RepID=UPI000C19F3EE|nr:hypothetical protein [Deinococcus sp. UR1]PIG96906.1 hypothetical protein AMD26_015380 [Deinococcus sp. UR1]
MIGVTGRERVLYFQPGSGAVIGSTPGAILRPSMTSSTRVTYPRRGMYLDVRLAPGSVRFGRYFAVRGQDGRMHVRWWRTTGIWEAE